VGAYFLKINFPGNNLQVSKKADGILFLSLLSGRNPEYLIGQQVIAAPKVKEAQIESIPTGYILIDGGKETAVSYISNTKAIPRDKPEIALATCMAAELLGKKLLYIEAGSGASQSIPPATIQLIKKHVDLPVIVGGGVRSVKAVQELLDAGADHVVIGNHIEENPEFMAQLSDLFLELNLVKD
jgi:phosphoglycerol geranylgeranyltransferase